MKSFRQSVLLFFVFFLAALSFTQSSCASVKITIQNNLDHNLSLAFRWAGFDMPDDRRSGWYNVRGGESKTLTFEDAVYALTEQDFGFYATGGGKVWRGSPEDERPLPVIIHPKQAFRGGPEDPVDGGKKVYFRRIHLKETGSDRKDGKATLTFNP